MEKNIKEKSRVWIISELFYPEMISTGYIMTEIANKLSEQHLVEVIAGPMFYEKKENELRNNDRNMNFSVHRINDYSYNKNSLLHRGGGNLIIAWRLFSLMRKKVPDRANILMVTNPIMLVFFVSLICSRRKWRIKLLVHDIFPENLMVLNQVRKKVRLIFPLLKWIFNWAFQKMTHVIVLGRDMKVVVEKKLKKSDNIIIIENWSNTNDIQPYPVLNNVRKFLFAGNLGRVQGIQTLLNSLTHVNSKKFRFTFVGTGAMTEVISNFIQQHPDINIDLKGWVPRENQNALFGEVDIGVVSLEKGMYGLGVPSKLYNLLAAGKPVLYIGDKGSEIELLLKEYKFGWFAEAGDLQSISKTIEVIIEAQQKTLIEYSETAKQLANNLYRKDIILNKFSQLFSDEYPY